MHVIHIYVGASHANRSRLKAIRAYLLEKFGGFTETRATGGYMQDDEPRIEPAIVWEIMEPTNTTRQHVRDRAERAAQYMRKLLKEDSVLVRINGTDKDVNLNGGDTGFMVTEESSEVVEKL